MIYNIKDYLLEEGVLEHVKNNMGKYALAGAGALAAGAGELGDTAEGFANSTGNAISKGVDKLSNIGQNTMDHYSGGPGVSSEKPHFDGTVANDVSNNSNISAQQPNVGVVSPADNNIHHSVHGQQTIGDWGTNTAKVVRQDDFEMNTPAKILAGGAGLGAAALAGKVVSPLARSVIKRKR